MALREVGEDGSVYDVPRLPHREEFDATWSLISARDQALIEDEINRRLDALIASPNPNWGSITNTSERRTDPLLGERRVPRNQGRVTTSLGAPGRTNFTPRSALEASVAGIFRFARATVLVQ
jgi:hypothetical protein